METVGNLPLAEGDWEESLAVAVKRRADAESGGVAE